MSDILHQADQQQFICEVDGKLSRLAYRRLDATTPIFSIFASCFEDRKL